MAEQPERLLEQSLWNALTTSWSVPPARRLQLLMVNKESEWVVGDVGSARPRSPPCWLPRHRERPTAGVGPAGVQNGWLSVFPPSQQALIAWWQTGNWGGWWQDCPDSRLRLGTMLPNDLVYQASGQSILGLKAKSWFIAFTTFVYHTTCWVAADQYWRRTLVGSILGFDLLDTGDGSQAETWPEPELSENISGFSLWGWRIQWGVLEDCLSRPSGEATVGRQKAESWLVPDIPAAWSPSLSPVI